MGSRLALEAVAREMAAWDQPRPQPPKRRARKHRNDSISYSIRLYPEEVDMIQDRAQDLGIRPTAFARNLIRAGLAAERSDDVADAVDRLGQVVDELRSLVSR